MCSYSGSVATMDLKIQAVQKAQGTEAPQTAKAKAKTASEIRQCGKNQVHSMAIIYSQGWRLQRPIRLIQETTRAVDEYYNYMHKACRGETKTLEHYQKLSGLRPPNLESQSLSNTRDRPLLPFLQAHPPPHPPAKPETRPPTPKAKYEHKRHRTTKTNKIQLPGKIQSILHTLIICIAQHVSLDPY